MRSGVMAAAAAGEVVARRRTQLDPPGQQALDLLVEELSRQQLLLPELLALAHARSEQVSAEPILLLPVVQEAVRHHRRPVQVRAAPEAVEATTRTHPGWLGRVLANLLDNADRHGGGATAVHVGHDFAQAWVAVDDAGPGVPPHQRDKIFRRLSSRPADPHDAVGGLGLALCRQHARSAGGDLVIEDSPDGGARFLLVLPALRLQREGQGP